MSYTFSIKKDDWETFLEIKVAKEIMEYDPLVHHYVEKCFERVFQLIREVVNDKQSKKEENSEQQEENSSE